MVDVTVSFEAISDGTRRRILDLLRNGTLNAGEIARRFGHMSRPAVSKHLAILRRARLVVARRRGRELRYSLNAEPLRSVDAWLREYEVFWDRQLRTLKEYVESSPRKRDKEMQNE
jgi:DNA-binding transcriptional ArsR family regulator